MNRLLLKHVQPIGFSARLQAGMDVRIDGDGTVGAIGWNLEPAEEDRVADLSGLYLSPGWIDMHAHVYDGVSNAAVNPDEIGPCTGVTGIVDAGSAGCANFSGFRDYVIMPRSFPVYSFLNLGATGLLYANDVSELDSLDKINLDRLVSCVNDNRAYIKGIKIRASGVIMRGLGVELVKLAKRTAVELDLPLMVHVGEPLPMLEDILELLERGDIVTHCYHGKKWGIFRKGELIPELMRACERGVLLDVGHGSASFHFEVAEKAIALGCKPYSLGTDLHIGNVNGPVWDLPTTMSKLLALGLSLEEVIRGVTAHPAAIVGMERFQQELIGTRARFTAFALDSAAAQVEDSYGQARRIHRVIRPVYTVMGAEAADAGLRHPLQ